MAENPATKRLVPPRTAVAIATRIRYKNDNKVRVLKV